MRRLKNRYKLLIVGLLLTLISALVFIIFGHRYTATIDLMANTLTDSDTGKNLSIEDIDISIESSEDAPAFKIENTKLENGILSLDLVAVRRGKSDLVISAETATEDSPFNIYQFVEVYIHPFNILSYDGVLGRTTGEIVVPISVFLFISYAIFLTIKAFRASIRENFFRHKNIALLSAIIFLSFFDIVQFFQLFNYTGLVSTLDAFGTSFLAFSIFTLPVAFVISVLCIFASIALMRRERRFSWRLTLTVILGLLFCILSSLPNFIDELVMTTPYYSFLHDLNTPWPFIQSVFELLFAELSAYLECLLIATVLLCVKAGRHIPEDNQDFLIILGCHVMPDGSPTKELKKRLDRAIEFYNSQKKTNGNPPTIIVSGGKGNNEPISEAESMKKYLLEHKIPASKIIKEEKSTTTFENLKFSKKIIPKDSKVSIVTTNYHVFRAGILATSFKLKVSSLGAKVSSPLWLNSIVREYIAVLFAEKRRHIFTFVAIVILVSLVEAVVYWHYAN